MITKEELIKFEEEIGELNTQELIKSPVHLEGSINGELEDKLIKLFKDLNINKDSWIFSTHRSHYPWLLSGRDPEELKKQILEGHSMHIYGNKYFTSAIVSGVAPIALGVAYGLKLKRSVEEVFCFLGDMAGSGGLVYECVKYAEQNNLPITYFILNNKYSVRALTSETWGICEYGVTKLIDLIFDRKYPHAGYKDYRMF
jgi:TPP-dependent pyruvate/acetoin dehydrogenase alpha subunit